MEPNFLQTVCISLLPIIFAVTMHEAAHGWMAAALGDPTAKQMGRLTLNPLKHIDLLGTIIVPILSLVFIKVIFGWAKPVPVNWNNFQRPRRDMALVALAGPVSNLLMAIMWAMVAKIGEMSSYVFGTDQPIIAIAYMGIYGIFINIVFFALNMLPIPPLDGAKVIAVFLSDHAVKSYNRIEPYGFLIIIVLLSCHALFNILSPMVDSLENLIVSMFL